MGGGKALAFFWFRDAGAHQPGVSSPVVSHDDMVIGQESRTSDAATANTWRRSFYFFDPDGIMLEFCATVNEGSANVDIPVSANGLQAHMQREAGFSLPRAQSMIMTEGPASSMELAMRLKVSKQAIRQALRAMIERDLVTVNPDPANGRQRIVQVSEHGQAMRDIASHGLERLEREPARRIGRDRVEVLHEVLNAPWGPALDDGGRAAGDAGRES